MSISQGEPEQSGTDTDIVRVQYDEEAGVRHSWDFDKIIQIPPSIKSPTLHCCKSEREVVLGDAEEGAIFMVNLDTETVKQIDVEGHIVDCSFHDGTLIASDFESGRIALIDDQGIRVKDFEIPNATPSSIVMFAVDGKSRSIVAGVISSHAKVLHFIDAKSGEAVKTCSVEANELLGRILTTSTGLVVVRTGADEFSVIDGDSARQRSRLRRKEWRAAQCAVDSGDGDTLFITSLRESKTKPPFAVVDEITIDGRVKKAAALEFRLYSTEVPAPLITPRGRLVVCNGKEILVYQKVYPQTSAKAKKKWVKV